MIDSFAVAQGVAFKQLFKWQSQTIWVEELCVQQKTRPN